VAVLSLPEFVISAPLVLTLIGVSPTLFLALPIPVPLLPAGL
jgi:hypothetical protein